MTRTLAILFGIVYAIAGIMGLFNTSLVGTNGVFAADTAYSIAFLVVAAVLLFGALFDRTAVRGITLTVGILLALFAVASFVFATGSGQVLGMLTNAADRWGDLIIGVILAGTALFATASENAYEMTPTRRYVRHAMQ